MLTILTLLLTAAPPAAPRDVVECTLALPADIGPFAGLPVEVRKQALAERGAVIDKKNGFVSFTTDWTDAGWTRPYDIQVAIFQRRDRSFIVGVTNSSGTALDGSSSGLGFYELLEGEWRDVTAEVAPTLAVGDLWTSKKKKPPTREQGFLSQHATLPREGTTVTVALRLWVPLPVDDGQQDVSTAADRARAADLEGFVAENSRVISLAWSPKTGTFTRR